MSERLCWRCDRMFPSMRENTEVRIPIEHVVFTPLATMDCCGAYVWDMDLSGIAPWYRGTHKIRCPLGGESVDSLENGSV